METIRFVDASLSAFFQEGTPEETQYMREFRSLLSLHDDPLSVWLKSDKVRKESEETDKILLTLMTELYRKIDDLTLRLTTEGPLHLPLESQGIIDRVGHTHFCFDCACLQEGKSYYTRIDMPTFPRRYLPLFFEACDTQMAKIILMHEDDKKDWSAYMAACERVMIRQMKGKENGY